MIRRLTMRQIYWLSAFMAGDALVAASSLFFAVMLRRSIYIPGTESLLPPGKFPLNAANFALVVATFLLSLALSGFYDWQRSARHRPFLFAALVIQIVLITFGAVLLARPYPRSVLLFVPLFEALILPLWRRVWTAAVSFRPAQTILVGDPARIDALIEKIAHHREPRVQIAGIVGSGPSTANSSLYLGSIADADVLERVRDADEVIYMPDDSEDLRMMLLEVRGPEGYLLLPSHREALLSSGRFTWIADQPLVEVSARAAYGVGAIAKRAVDIIFSATILLILLPALAVIAIALAVNDGFPIIIRQTRTGRGGRPFELWKFRSIRKGRESLDLVREGDDRVTGVGSWLRRHRLDEMPQLINVLRGDMSLVGPRPERPEIADRIAEVLPAFRLRTIVRPGLAGLAQVCGDYHTDSSTKLLYDLRYITTWSLALDLRILLTAVPTSLSGRGL